MSYRMTMKIEMGFYLSHFSSFLAKKKKMLVKKKEKGDQHQETTDANLYRRRATTSYRGIQPKINQIHLVKKTATIMTMKETKLTITTMMPYNEL